MRRFLYGRLKGRHLDYAFYIPFGIGVGPLADAIARYPVGAGNRLLFLQSWQGRISFGVKEELTLRDHGNRLRDNFMGYVLEGSEGPTALPFFDALRSQFEAITREAHECHARLDEDSSSGTDLREMRIRFGRGRFYEGNAWDVAIEMLGDNPGQDLLVMFDDGGNELASLVRTPEPTMGRQRVYPGSPSSVPPPASTPTLANEEQTHHAATGTLSAPAVSRRYELGIVPSLELRKRATAVILPIDRAPQETKFGCLGRFLRASWGHIETGKTLLRSKSETTKEGRPSDDEYPRG